MAVTKDKKAINDFRRVVGDAFAFVRSMEANQSLSALTIEDMMSEVIARNGGDSEAEIGNFIVGSVVSTPTKIERIKAIKTKISDTVQSLKEYDPSDLADDEDYASEAEGVQ